MLGMNIFAAQKMQNFLTLSETEQRNVVSESGEVLIDSRQGDTVITIYRVKEFFVKITKGEKGNCKIEVMKNLDDIKLFNDKQ